MLTSLNRIAGMPVIWQDRQIGCVERAIADASARRLRGLVIRKGIGQARWLPSSSVRLVGRTCVLAGAKPEPLPDGLTDSALQAYLTTGERAGLVSDALFSGLTLRLVALEVTPGPVYALLGRCAYTVSYRVAGDGKQTMVSELMTWAEFRERSRREAWE